jgi:hypothetical protein
MGVGAGAAMTIVHPRVKDSTCGAASLPTRCTTFTRALCLAPPDPRRRRGGARGLRAAAFLAFLLRLRLPLPIVIAVVCRAGMSAVAPLYSNTVEIFIHVPAAGGGE